MDAFVLNPTMVFAIVVPIFLWLANAVVRSHRGLPLSTGSDLLLVCLAFDVAVLGSIDQFRPLAVNAEFAAGLGAYFSTLLVVVLVLWLVACFYLEPLLASNYDSYRRHFRVRTSGFFTSVFFWLFIWLVAYAHLRAFQGEG